MTRSWDLSTARPTPAGTSRGDASGAGSRGGEHGAGCDCRVHNGDVAARVTGERSDDRQSVNRHGSLSDTDVIELDVVCAAEHVLEPLECGLCAALQLVLVRRPGRREQHPVFGLAKIAPRAVDQPAKQTG